MPHLPSYERRETPIVLSPTFPLGIHEHSRTRFLKPATALRATFTDAFMSQLNCKTTELQKKKKKKKKKLNYIFLLFNI